jgi:hypothetical protein
MARLPGALGFIIGVETIAEFGVEERIGGEEGSKNESLEKPSYMGEMPFGRARIFMRLDCLVLGAERRREVRRQSTAAKEALFEIGLEMDRFVSAALRSVRSQHVFLRIAELDGRSFILPEGAGKTD